jgi:hypothetical protein
MLASLAASADKSAWRSFLDLGVSPPDPLRGAPPNFNSRSPPPQHPHYRQGASEATRLPAKRARERRRRESAGAKPPGSILERETGIEPATNSLEGCDSTTELLPRLIGPSLHRLIGPSLHRLIGSSAHRRPNQPMRRWADVVARGGFEPPKPLGRQIYSLLRLTASLPRRSRPPTFQPRRTGALGDGWGMSSSCVLDCRS